MPPHRLAPLVAVFALGGCAAGHDPRDPLESFNRGVERFNDQLDRAVLKPAAQGYRAVTNEPVRGGVSSFFRSGSDVVSGVNTALQLRPADALSDLARVVINGTLGILGFFDVATRLGIPRHGEGFGNTLGRWGMPPGPYLVLPVLGPADLRDGAGLLVDMEMDPTGYLSTERQVNYTAWGVHLVDTRSALLDSQKLLDAAVVGDRYAFTRDAYLAYRIAAVEAARRAARGEAATVDAPRRKTLKEQEEELDGPDPEAGK